MASGFESAPWLLAPVPLERVPSLPNPHSRLSLSIATPPSLSGASASLDASHTTPFNNHPMATAFKPGGVRDVPHGEFIAAYAKHLKGNDRVRLFFIYFLRRGDRRPQAERWKAGGKQAPGWARACVT